MKRRERENVARIGPAGIPAEPILATWLPGC